MREVEHGADPFAEPNPEAPPAIYLMSLELGVIERRPAQGAAINGYAMDDGTGS